MPIPEITLEEIENIADEKDEIYRGYLHSIDDIYTLYSVYINHNKVAVCNIIKAENGYEIIDFIGSHSVIKIIEKKIENWK
ncbi:hypothetical protein [Pontibacillus sp. HMF3514]|uniref:hypothetical protein n=1 Tax=Pontibacillus sp. HMF3514 TaxID=2692425 RepID=UPI00131F64F6|nr:hypothetical protein [Pontibacillus sp. HMF3514]QHE51594.1 hypothetical protein GS400_05885 [Pontibacillus sp. HMF3514]